MRTPSQPQRAAAQGPATDARTAPATRTAPSRGPKRRPREPSRDRRGSAILGVLPRDAIRAVAGRVFLLDPDPKATVEQDVEAAVTERLRMDDLSGSRHAVDRWAAFVVILPVRTQHRDDHPSFALEAVGDHLPVTG